MALPGAGGMGLPDGSVGRVLLGGIEILPLCGSDLVCLTSLASLPCVDAGGGSSLSIIVWISSLQDTDFFFGVSSGSSLLTP